MKKICFQPPTDFVISDKKQAYVSFQYECRFWRRKGWRMKPVMEGPILLDSDAEFLARQIAITFEGDQRDEMAFFRDYTIELLVSNGPAINPRGPSILLLPQVEIKTGRVIVVRFIGKPGEKLIRTARWRVCLYGLKVYPIA